MASNFLDTFGPYFAAQSLAGQMPEPDIQTTGPLQMGAAFADPRNIPTPEMRQKRSVGNVLSDFFSGSRIAKNMRDPGIAAWSDALSNIARAARGEDPTHSATDYASVLRAQDQQQASFDRGEQARNAFAQLLLNPSAEREAALGQLDPQSLLSYRDQNLEAQRYADETERKGRVDAFNAGKPIPLGGNGGYAIFDPEAGWSIHEGQPPMQRFETGEGQAGLVDPRTGAFRPIGGKKIPAMKTATVTVEGPNGPEVRVIDASKPGVVGAAPAKAGAQPAAAGDVAKVLRDSNITFDSVDKLIKGSTSGRLENYASMVPGVFGETTPGQKNIAQLQTIDNAVVLALAGGKLGAGVSNADRDFFKEMSGKISDPNEPAEKRRAAWKQVWTRLEKYLKPGTQSAPAASSVNRDAVIAELRRRGRIK